MKSSTVSTHSSSSSSTTFLTPRHWLKITKSKLVCRYGIADATDWLAYGILRNKLVFSFCFLTVVCLRNTIKLRPSLFWDDERGLAPIYFTFSKMQKLQQFVSSLNFMRRNSFVIFPKHVVWDSFALFVRAAAGPEAFFFSSKPKKEWEGKYLQFKFTFPFFFLPSLAVVGLMD
jgi:hypothetical protein